MCRAPSPFKTRSKFSTVACAHRADIACVLPIAMQCTSKEQTASCGMCTAGPSADQTPLQEQDSDYAMHDARHEEEAGPEGQYHEEEGDQVLCPRAACISPLDSMAPAAMTSHCDALRAQRAFVGKE